MTVLNLVLLKMNYYDGWIEVIEDLIKRGANAKEDGLLFVPVRSNRPEIVRILV
jgi:hypothetical protein